jgi:hypothetical protein
LYNESAKHCTDAALTIHMTRSLISQRLKS